MVVGAPAAFAAPVGLEFGFRPVGQIGALLLAEHFYLIIIAFITDVIERHNYETKLECGRTARPKYRAPVLMLHASVDFEGTLL